MKNYLKVFLLIGLTNLTIAQNDIAHLALPNPLVYNNSETILNSEYLTTVTNKEFPVNVQNLQNAVANYNIKTSDVYLSKIDSDYIVKFKQANNFITASYDKDGQLLTCQENYKSIKLPYVLSSKLIKEYPNWGIKKVDCEIQYTKDKQHSEIIYRVLINNKNKSKRIALTL
ncbi:hypothetical protein SAMN05444372_104200 [Flavobacterium micromati]|uniref:Nicotinate-nucleotide adenylyltransferase n=1 Tax=Flavobacterium micromati TaxID=229205 RepID=A0A1M5IQH8_9FLAO|nr:hypothetical protein [Flavobacterium micromati]SHG30562.1 hypothetical protein SAMN05444372_104200 [Flavobacterium micromati]